MPPLTYSQKLRDPRWQKVRLKVFERDHWKCQSPKCPRKPNRPLAVHHKSYLSGRAPWEYPLDNFVTFCEDCHEQQHNQAMPAGSLKIGAFYSWNELPALLGFTPKGYLTQSGDQIRCGCFRLDLNPDAPDILLAGDDERVVAQAKLFAEQKEPIPIFVKATDAGWEYCGQFKVEGATINKQERKIHGERAGRKDVAMVLFLQKGRGA